MRKQLLPFSLPDLDQAELDEIREVLESNWITTGPKVHEFEREFAARVGASHAVAVNSCTAAMHLALDAVGVERGSLVITSPYTFAASAEVIRYFDATPVFVDTDLKTLNMDATKLAEAVEHLMKGGGPRPPSAEDPSQGLKAIVPVHIGGLPADLDAIFAVARKHRLAIIEDAAHAFPAKYKGRFVGQGVAGSSTPPVPHLTCFSFYATKTITTGEGGMICTHDPLLAERCRIMSLHGISKDAWKRYSAEGSWFYEIIAPGYKYNMTDVAAAMGLAQLRKANRMWHRRQEIAHKYNAAFEGRSELQIPADQADCEHAWHLYVLRLNLDRLTIDRSRFIEELKSRNIGTSVHFIPLHLHPYYRETYAYQAEDFPVAYREYQRVISLPIYSKMTDQDIQDVIDAVLDTIEKFRR